VGGARTGLSCDKPQDCPGIRANTSCKKRPIDNLSRMMALLLFSGKIKNWQDFGPWYPDLNVALCMRHGGSGTHGTLDTRVMRGDLGLLTTTRAFAENDPTGEAANFFQLPIAWHYKSSTTLTEDCVEYYDGGVGYVDADKVVDNDFTSAVHHIPFHEGVEPFRMKIYMGEYPFWGAASCYYDQDGAAGLSPNQQALADALLTWAADQDERVEYPTSLFWATGAEMTVTAPNDFAYPSK
jgi:ABC-type phosphate transport system substrate-binding protein